MNVLRHKYTALLSFSLLFSIILTVTSFLFVLTFIQLDNIEIEAELSISEEGAFGKLSSGDASCFDIEYFYYKIKDNFFHHYNSGDITMVSDSKWNNPYADLLLPPPKLDTNKV